MTPLPWLAGLLLPACREQGAGGLALPPPERPLRLVPDAASETRGLPLPPAVLAQEVAAAAAALPRFFPHAFYETPAQLHFVARSARLNLPLRAVADITPLGSGSRLVLAVRAPRVWRRRALAERWLHAWSAALDARLSPTLR